MQVVTTLGAQAVLEAAELDRCRALRTTRVADGVIVEVGGTSTNVAAIRGGQPALSYVQVAGRATAIRALDVQVTGVAGGSMLRVRRGKVYGVGPRSAHIAGLPYACFLSKDRLDGASMEATTPRPGDPDDYMILHLVDGTRIADQHLRGQRPRVDPCGRLRRG